MISSILPKLSRTSASCWLRRKSVNAEYLLMTSPPMACGPLRWAWLPENPRVAHFLVSQVYRACTQCLDNPLGGLLSDAVGRTQVCDRRGKDGVRRAKVFE